MKICAAAVFTALLLAPLTLFGQTAAAPAISLTATPASGVSPLEVIVAWSTVPAATSCTPSGTFTWPGTATQDTGTGSTEVTLLKTTRLTLSCTWKATKVAPPVTVSWTAPTQNTDGSALTNLQGYSVYFDSVTPPTKLAGTVAAGTTSDVIPAPPLGTDYAAVTAVNQDGAASALSNIASLTVAASVLVPSITKVAFIAVTVSAAAAAPLRGALPPSRRSSPTPRLRSPRNETRLPLPTLSRQCSRAHIAYWNPLRKTVAHSSRYGQHPDPGRTYHDRTRECDRVRLHPRG